MEAAAASEADVVTAVEDLEKCGVKAEAESGISLGVMSISSEDVEDRLPTLSVSLFFEAMEAAAAAAAAAAGLLPKSRPVILLVASMTALVATSIQASS